MHIDCPNCGAVYHIPSERIPEKGAHTKCKKCGTRFFVSRPVNQTPPVDGSAPVQPPRQPAAAGPAASTESALDSALSDELLQQLIQQGDEIATANRLLELIDQYIHLKDFITVEGLHAKIYELAPMAISEAVTAGEKIEAAKSRAVDADNLKLWDDLYQRLTVEERNALYYAMQPLIAIPDQVIYRQGDFNDRLYFVQQGDLNLLIQDPRTLKTETIKRIKAGDVANISPFFSFTVCTASLVAVGDAQLTFLDKTLLKKWKTEFPGIDANLQNFCEAKGTAVDWAKQANINIRAFERIKTSQTAAIQLLDQQRKPVQNPFKAALYDISAGGACFSLKIYQQEEAEKLLNHRLFLQAVFSPAEGRQTVKRLGTIMAVHIRPFGESSVHVRFDQALDDEVMTTIKTAA